MQSSKDDILATLRAGLAKNRAWLETEAARAPHAPPPFVHPPQEDLAAQFVAELSKLEGKAYRCADDEEALEIIGGILAERGTTTAITWDLEQIGLPGLGALLQERGIARLATTLPPDGRKEQLQVLEPALVCISGVEVGVAESCTLLLRHGPGRPRVASLLAPTHIAILRTTQLVRGLGEALALVRWRYGDAIFADTSNLTLITGPSRTADIELTLTLGIHGPKEIHVVVVGD